MIAIYVVIVPGGYLFNTAKNELNELELQVNRID